MFIEFSGKNLLAFSAGVDSTFLFFKLLEKGIQFDVIMVDYNMREQSKAEVSYARGLCKQYGKNFYLKSVEAQKEFSEHLGRKIRYDFFKEIVTKHSYENVLTAHQLNDKVEWMLMQMSKGAGLVEMLGMEEVSYKDELRLIRPILNYSRNEILNYLEDNKIKYFIDESNLSDKYKRNTFRNSFCNEFVEKYSSGIKKSFEFLEIDSKELIASEKQIIVEKYDIFLSTRNSLTDNNALRIIDKELKKRKFLLNQTMKKTLLKNRELNINSNFYVYMNDEYVLVSPYSNSNLIKCNKKEFSSLKIAKGVRPYLQDLGISGQYFVDNFIKKLSKN